MAKIEATILRDAALRPTSIKLKKLKIGYEYYPNGAVSKVILSGPRASIPNLFAVLDMIYPRDVNVSVRGSQYFDRNATPKAGFIRLVNVPHALISRLTYTVSSQQIAKVELIDMEVIRTIAAAPVGTAEMRCTYTPKGGSGTIILRVRLDTNTVGDFRGKTLGESMTMYEGDNLNVDTADSSTGGQISYFFAYKLTEFDE